MSIEFPCDIYYGIQKGSIEAYTTMSNYIMRALLEKFEREGMVLNDSDREFFSQVMEKRMIKKSKPVDKCNKR